MADAEILDRIATGICVTDEYLDILIWNNEMERVSGVAGHEICGKNLGDYFPLFMEESISLRLEMTLTTGAPLVLSPLLHRDLFQRTGREIWNYFLEVTVNTYKTLDGKDTLLFTVRDVTELNLQIQRAREEIALRKAAEDQLQRANEKLQQLADTDPLTGLLNRRSTLNLLENEIVRFQRQGTPFSVILSDIDHFKKFNDNYGHDCGDDVLIHIGRLIGENIRALDGVSRWGGEEFLVVLPGSDVETTAEVAEKLRLLVSRSRCRCMPPSERITMTFGISQFRKGDVINNLIKRADEALYRGKEGGRNRVETG